MRRDELYFADIVAAADAVAGFLAGVEEEDFAGNDLLRSAILQKLIVIGEAAGRVSAEAQSRYADIPWSEIVAFRNIAIHAYFSVDWSIVWTTAIEEVPVLRGQVVRILDQIDSGEQA